MAAQAQSDPWLEAAKNFKSSSSSTSAPANDNEDWKIWQSDHSEKKSDIPNGQHGMGTLADTAKEAGHSLVDMAQGLGRVFEGGPEQIPQNIGRAFVEPSVQEWNTPSQKGVMIGGTGHPTLDKVMRSVPVLGPMTANADRINQEEGFGPAAANLITPVAAGEAGGGLLKAFSGPATRAGLGLGNDALGATGPKAFKYGQNAARGAYEENALPALSKHGAAMNIEEALPKVGREISNKVMSSPNKVATADISKSVNEPLNEALDVMGGPGGGGRNMQPIFDLHDSMSKVAPKATSPVFGSAAPVDASAPDVWRTIQNIDKNTRFNPDPEIEGANELRRSIRGGLRGNLESAVPDLKPSTQRYADLKQAEESLDRTMHGGMDIGHMLDAAKFPIQTTVGRGLYSAGKAARPLSPVFSKAFPAVYAASQRKDQ